MIARITQILILITLTACSLFDDTGGDNDWFWYFTIEDPEGNDMFLSYKNYDVENLVFYLDSADRVSDSDYWITRDSSANVLFRKFNSGNGKVLSYYFDYQNGDIDTLRVEVDGPVDRVIWRHDGFIDIDKIYFFFNDSLHYTFDIKNNPGLDLEIVDYKPGPREADVLTITNDRFLLRFKKKSVVTDK